MAKAKAAKNQPNRRGRKPILTDDKVDQVRELVAARKTEYEIAKELDCKPHNVTSFRRRHGITYLKGKPFTYKEDGMTVKRFPGEYAEGAERPRSVKARTRKGDAALFNCILLPEKMSCLPFSFPPGALSIIINSRPRQVSCP